MMLSLKKGLLVVLSGPSGVGKGTVRREVLKYFNSWYSVSVTSRKKREGEMEGKDYFFVTREEFEQKIRDNEFLEYNIYNGNYYGTLKSKIDEKLEKNIDVFVEIEVNGAKNIKNVYEDSILIYILPPSMEELEERLRNRDTEDEETIRNRLDIAKDELKELNIYDYVVINDKIDDTVLRIKNIIESEKYRVSRNNIWF